jgi:ATP-dependent DNA helicase RecG
MNISELKQLIANRENENVELKEWKNSISVFGKEKLENKKCLLGYCVALGNESGGKLIFGVQNNGVIIGTHAQINFNQIKKKIYDKTGQKISIEEVFDKKKRIIVVSIPSRPMGKLLKFAGVPLMRIGESLEEMSDDEQRRILLEGQDDFSAQICKTSSIKIVDQEALKKLRKLYQAKHSKNKTIQNLSDEQFLTDLGLMKKRKLNYAGVILLAQKEFLDNFLGRAEVCFEYRNNNQQLSYNDRVDYRKPFVLLAFEIWEKVLSRQQVNSFIDGFFRRDIPAYNEEVFREALFNAVCHRDYRQEGSIFIKQSPEEIEISNPGGFPHGVNVENIIFAPSAPRNRLLAEMFQKIFQGVERSGQGADKIFRYTIEEGKGKPDYTFSDRYHVVLKIPTMLKDGEFLKYLEKINKEKQASLSVSDLLLLDQIREGDMENITLKTVGYLLEKEFIELHGRTRGAKYVLSQRYYKEIGKLGERTRRIGLARDKCKELILEHIRKHKQGTMTEFMQIFPELKRSDVSNLISELKKDKKIKKHGEKRWAKWIVYT